MNNKIYIFILTFLEHVRNPSYIGQLFCENYVQQLDLLLRTEPSGQLPSRELDSRNQFRFLVGNCHRYIGEVDSLNSSRGLPI
jgi:hypothetical protein